MKKVLAIVLAVVMVCTMAMAVTIKPGDAALPGTTTEDKVPVQSTAIEPGSTVALELDADKVVYYTKDGKFVPANNVVTVTFAKGAELVASQGWVKTGPGDGANAYQYQIKFKSDLTKVADMTVADIVISGVTFKATGYNAVTLLKATKNAEMLGYAFGYTKNPITLKEGATTIGIANNAINVVEKLTDKNDKEVSSLEVTIGGEMTYVLTKGAKLYAMKEAPAFTEKELGTGTVKDKEYQNPLNLAAKVNYAKGVNADKAYNVYAKTADGKILAVAATTTDGVMSFTVPAMSTVILTTSTLTTSGTAGTITGTTTNPGTGANDVVGVAAALAVVALVSGAAISLKK